MSEFTYLHGFSDKEQARLKAQAEFIEYPIYQNINFSEVSKILEVGCGVGAQTEILLRRFPKLHVTGIDLNEKQLAAAKDYIGRIQGAANRFYFERMSADKLSFKDKTFEGAFFCWILEHVPDPAAVLKEVKRVLVPGSEVVITEVMNSTFFLNPYSPNVLKYWTAFNEFQFEKAGDPFVGAKLGNLLTQAGYKDIQTNIVTLHLDNRHVQKRKETILYWTDLLLSAADILVEEKYMDRETVDKVNEELGNVAIDPDAVFMYSFMQAKARA